jgi:ParB family transcriptional regulator, chromosome partitioning protein
VSSYKVLGVDQLTTMLGGQPRQYFNPQAMEELAESIKEIGIIQPLILRHIENDRYEILCGERRWRGAQMARVYEVPCIVMEEHEIDSALLIALVENIQREDLTPLEEARAFKAVKEELISQGKKGSFPEIAKAVSKGRDMVLKTMSILKLSDATISYFEEYPEDLNKGHAYALQGLEQGHEVSLIEEILAKKMPVRAVEKKAQRFRDSYKNAPLDYSGKTDVDVKDLERQISEALGCEATINVSPKSKKYELKLATWGGEAFEGIMEAIGVSEAI